MKTCPICQARAFDDAEVCYGCLHRFVKPDEDAGDDLGWEFDRAFEPEAPLRIGAHGADGIAGRLAEPAEAVEPVGAADSAGAVQAADSVDMVGAPVVADSSGPVRPTGAPAHAMIRPLPSFQITLIPPAPEAIDGSWRCSVDLVPA